jgi:hypothetical protein
VLKRYYYRLNEIGVNLISNPYIFLKNLVDVSSYDNIRDGIVNNINTQIYFSYKVNGKLKAYRIVLDNKYNVYDNVANCAMIQSTSQTLDMLNKKEVKNILLNHDTNIFVNIVDETYDGTYDGNLLYNIQKIIEQNVDVKLLETTKDNF